jgi:hypothetical protein
MIEYPDVVAFLIIVALTRLLLLYQPFWLAGRKVATARHHGALVPAALLRK